MPNREPTPALYDFASRWETFRANPYFATASERAIRLYTWGFGHTGKNPPQRSITREEGIALFAEDMAEANSYVTAVAHPSLTDAQYNAMVDLVFNAGPGVIGPTTGTGQALRAGDVATLRVKLPQFRNQTDPVTRRLVPTLGVYRRAIGRLALFDGKSAEEAERIGRAITSLEDRSYD